MKSSLLRSHFVFCIFAFLLSFNSPLGAQTRDPAPEGDARRKIIEQIQKSQATSPEILRVTIAQIGLSESEQTIAVEQEDGSYKRITMKSVNYRFELRVEGVIRTRTQLKVGDTITVEHTNNYPGHELYNIPDNPIMKAGQKYKVYLRKDPDEKKDRYLVSAAFASFILEKTDP